MLVSQKKTLDGQLSALHLFRAKGFRGIYLILHWKENLLCSPTKCVNFNLLVKPKFEFVYKPNIQ